MNRKIIAIWKTRSTLAPCFFIYILSIEFYAANKKEADTLGHNQNQKLNFDLDIVVLTTVSTTIFFRSLLLKEEKLRFSSLNLNFWFLFPFSPLHVRKYASRGWNRKFLLLICLAATTPVELDLEWQIKSYTAIKNLADFLITCNFLICLSPYLFTRNLRCNLLTHNRRVDFNWERRRYIKIFPAFICWKAPSIMPQ